MTTVQITTTVTRPVVQYGGFFGKTLITDTYYRHCWQDTVDQLSRLGESEAQRARIAEMQTELRNMIRVNSNACITEAQAEAAGIPLKLV